MHRLVTIALLMLAATRLSAQQREVAIIDGDTLTYHYRPLDQSDTSHSGGSGRTFLSPIVLGKGGEIAFMAAPAYSAETSLLLTAETRYTKHATQGIYGKYCKITLRGSASITGYYNVTLSARHNIESQPQQHIGYGATIVSEPRKVWGIGYDAAHGNIYHRYIERRYAAWTRYDITVSGVSLGLSAGYLYIEAVNLNAQLLEMLLGTPHNISTAGIGAHIGYDTRNENHNAYIYEGGSKGVRLALEAQYHPKILNNVDKELWSVGATIAYYQPLWRGSKLALDIYGKHLSANTPWLLSAELGGNIRMRGYYAGRYRGNTLLTAQLELRQRLWRGLGAAAWYGAGIAFSNYDTFAWQKILPSYGLGLRYKINHITLRADVAFGRNSFDIIFGLGEAF